MCDLDDPLAAAFRELEALVGGRGKLPGLDAARTTARIRRTRRAALTAAVTAVVLGTAGIAVGLADADHADQAAPVVGADTARVLADLNPVSLLRDATVEIPPFDVAGCPSGRLSFQGGSSAELTMGASAVGDIDRDGINDEVVPVTCTRLVTGGVQVSGQVLAFAGTDSRLLGRLRGLTPAENLYEALVDDDGVVGLDMFETGLVGDPTTVWREHYRWTGSGFGQPDRQEVAFDRGLNLLVGAEPGSLTVADGGAGARLQVTIRNVGSALSQPIEVALTSVAPLVVELDGWRGPLGRLPSDSFGMCLCRWRVLVDAPAPDETLILTFRLRLPLGRPLTAMSQLAVSVAGHVNARLFGEAWPQPADVLLRPS